MVDENALLTRCAQLERANAQLARINETLMNRVERDLDHQGSSYTLFQAAIALEAKVKERTGALSQALSTLERTNQDLLASKEAALAASVAKSTFLATMSHELRTPMNGVVGMTELLMSTALDDSQRASVRIIGESAHSLLRILNDILDFSKIEAGFLVTESTPFQLCDTVEQVLQLIRPQFVAKGLDFTLSWDAELPTSVIGDPTRFSQVVTNLLGNALKFTTEGSVALRASFEADGGEKFLLRIEVEDTGVGIRQDHLPKLFDSFTQSDSSITRKFGGTGLGLAIVRRLCQLMNGDCGVSSEFGTGSCFWVTIELHRDALQVPSTVPRSLSCAGDEAVTPLDALNVLVVEDNEVNQIVIRGFLRAFGCRCSVVDNGADAVRLLTASHDFDVVLMDCQMPVMDGLEATRHVRAFEAGINTRVPIVALTANAMVGDRDACMAAGMDDFLSKPFQGVDLRAALQRWAGADAPVVPAREAA